MVKLLVTCVLLGGLTLISLKAVNSGKITNLMNIEYNEYLLNSEYLVSSLYEFKVIQYICLLGKKVLDMRFGIPLITLKYYESFFNGDLYM